MFYWYLRGLTGLLNYDLLPKHLLGGASRSLRKNSDQVLIELLAGCRLAFFIMILRRERSPTVAGHN